MLLQQRGASAVRAASPSGEGGFPIAGDWRWTGVSAALATQERHPVGELPGVIESSQLISISVN
ncbi:hypothetical protein [Nostoc sp.]|uniref:hypothetical protein n=1 Tax=Nostoc sp. TaxID=1180 RepID=UPI002FF94748